MKKSDIYFALVAVAIFMPFVLCESLYNFYVAFNATHGMVMSFVKFAILATMGELLGLRITTGKYILKGFGILPHAIVWGLLGIWINLAFIVYSNGVPAFASYIGVENPTEILSGAMCWQKILLAFSISVMLNTTFGPVFMTFHKITDAHIHKHNGSIKALISPINMGEIMQNLNWRVQWNFVFKKTIPFFWFPAHTLTFLLPGEQRVLCAALLSVFLGILLSIAARKK